MPIQLPAELFDQFLAAGGHAEIVGPTGQRLVVEVVDESWIDRLPPELVLPYGEMPTLDADDLDDSDRDDDMTTEELLKHLASLPCFE